jgi:hypothetical protein
MQKKRVGKDTLDTRMREAQAEAAKVNEMFLEASVQRAKAEKILEQFLRASERVEGGLKDFSRKMGEVDERGLEDVRRLQTLNSLNVRMARGILSNFGRVRDMKANTLIVS